MSQLNQQFRHKSGPTNVLAFPNQAPAGICDELLGDIIICETVVEQEAKTQQKTALHHWAHLTIHGTLHLLGFDHLTDEEAAAMEQLEIELLGNFNIPNPYCLKGESNSQ